MAKRLNAMFQIFDESSSPSTLITDTTSLSTDLDAKTTLRLLVDDTIYQSTNINNNVGSKTITITFSSGDIVIINRDAAGTGTHRINAESVASAAINPTAAQFNFWDGYKNRSFYFFRGIEQET